MAKFKFRLEKILDLRKRKEEERERELAQLKKLLIQEEEFLSVLQKRGEAVSEKIGTLEAGDHGLDMKELLRYSEYLMHLREKIASQIATVKRTILNVEEKRQELVEASKERKVIEKLKTQQHKEFSQQMEKWESKIMDDIGTSNYSHRRRK